MNFRRSVINAERPNFTKDLRNARVASYAETTQNLHASVRDLK